MRIQANQETFRSYVFFWSGQLASLLGSSIAQFVIIWWVTIETGNAMYLALAAFLGLAPMVILGPFAGVLADRWNRKKLIGVVDFLQALATLVLVLLFRFGIVSIWHVFVLLTLRGVFQAFHQPAVSAITPSMVPKEKLSRMNGLNYLFSGAVNMIGPIVGAFLLIFWQIYDILWIDVATFLIAVVPLLIVAIPSVKMEKGNSSFKQDFSDGFSFIRNARGLLPLLFVATMLNFLLTPLSTLLPYYVKFDHLGDASAFALIMASFEGGILIGGLIMSLLKGFKRKMVANTLAIFAVFLGYAFVALTPTSWFWLMAISGLFMALFVPVANVTLQTIMQTTVPLNMQGRVFSVTMALAMAAQPAGIILSGTIAVLTGTANLFLACAAFGMLTMTLAWFFTDIRHVEKATEPAFSSEQPPT
ncbi:MFS transporter [Candidatus Bathyarchaeota archaeon]|nr:MFS transporter [Candidatus Bathyarchaeota archaeon]